MVIRRCVRSNLLSVRAENEYLATQTSQTGQLPRNDYHHLQQTLFFSLAPLLYVHMVFRNSNKTNVYNTRITRYVHHKHNFIPTN